jgi:hypothetical protein
MTNLTKCDFYGSRILVDENGVVTGDTFKVKEQLKKFFAAKWNGEKKSWEIGSTATFTKEQMIESLIHRYAVN